MNSEGNDKAFWNSHEVAPRLHAWLRKRANVMTEGDPLETFGTFRASRSTSQVEPPNQSVRS
jgi:hypothetical protein